MVLNYLYFWKVAVDEDSRTLYLKTKRVLCISTRLKVISSVGFQYTHNLLEKEEYLQECKGNCKAAVTW